MTKSEREYLQLAGWALATVVSIHGVTNRRWQTLHLLAIGVSALAILGSRSGR